MYGVYSTGYSATAPSEAGVLMLGDRRPSSSERPLICSGGYGGPAEWAVLEPRLGAHEYADSGRVAFSGDFGGTGTFGNDTSGDRIAEGWSWVKSQVPCATDKMLLCGQSGGCPDVINFAARDLSKVAALALLIPALDLADIHDNNRAFAPHPGGFAIDIENAYGGAAGWTAAEPTHNPVHHAAAIAAAGVPVLVAYSTDDPICLASIAQSFASSVGAELVNLGAVGHGISSLDRRRIFEFLRRYS